MSKQQWPCQRSTTFKETYVVKKKELVILYLYLRTKILTSLQNTISGKQLQLVVNNSFSSTVAMEKIGSSSLLLIRTSSSMLSPPWFINGTFKTAPELFFQLYTIQSCTTNRVLPCIYALLPNKQQATYTIFFKILKQLQHTLAPKNLTVDFEIAVLNAINTSFSGTNKKGCFFHFSQAIFQKIQSLGLQNRYKEDEHFAHKVHMLAALAFVPLPDVIDAFKSVADESPHDAQEVIDYFEDTYIGRLRPSGHSRALFFDLALWNMCDQTTGDLPRTNNDIEGWHRRFQANVGAYHPNFWKFIDILKQEQNLNHVNIHKLELAINQNLNVMTTKTATNE